MVQFGKAQTLLEKQQILLRDLDDSFCRAQTIKNHKNYQIKLPLRPVGSSP